MKKAVFISLAVFITDAFILGQGGPALILLIWGLLVLIGAILAKNRSASAHRFGRAGLYIVSALAVFCTIYFNNHLARSRGEDLVAALQKFHSANGRWPGRLSELSPRFIPEVPRAKATVLFGSFEYGVLQGRHFLSYTEIPPFGRWVYYPEEGAWANLD